ncbi:MAG: DUF998 domain-containing protein [Chloroflexota bacterium]
MSYSDGKIAGTLAFVAAAQFLLCLHIAESLYPSYSVSANYISDLGVGDVALLFNSSTFVLGILTLAAAYFINKAFSSKLLFILLVLTGIGAAGVGLLPENFGAVHAVVSLIAFLFGGLSAIFSCRLLKSPMSYFSVLLGLLSLISLAFFVSGNYLGLGHGGMERMIAHPILMWAIGFGGYLMSHGNETPTDKS